MNNGFILWTTGFSGSGKTTLTTRLEEIFKLSGLKVEVLDGDILRSIFKNTGFSKEDRDEHIRRVGFLAHLLARNGVIVLTATISPYREVRDELKKYPNFIEVFVDCPLEECIKRDVKGLYKKAIAGEIKQFTGISDPYEPPLNPDLTVNTDRETLEESTKKVTDFLADRGLTPNRCLWTWLGDMWELMRNDCGCSGKWACPAPTQPGSFIGQQITTPCNLMPPPATISCIWVWLGDSWEREGEGCPQGMCCPVPSSPGAFIGQQVTTPCLPC